MSLTAKRILFIGENSMGFHQIMTDSKKACQELTECAKIFYDYPSASIISEEELFGYTLKVGMSRALLQMGGRRTIGRYAAVLS